AQKRADRLEQKLAEHLKSLSASPGAKALKGGRSTKVSGSETVHDDVIPMKNDEQTAVKH
ncbi:MAG: hypothetical protein AAFO77_02190, partial [Pseudomonadota bacterium]